MGMEKKKIKIAGTALLFAAMFFVGRSAASFQTEGVLLPGMGNHMSEEAENWGLGFGAEGTKPTGNATAEELKKYNAYYVGDKEDKVIYLTFDCGYEGS